MRIHGLQKFSGHTSHGTMKVTAILALLGQLDRLPVVARLPRIIPHGVLAVLCQKREEPGMAA